MGNSLCVTSRDLCASREFPSFQPPNTDNVTYTFDFLNDSHLQLCHGEPGCVTSEGFLVEPLRLPEGVDRSKPSKAPKWSMIKERALPAEKGCSYISGRALVQIPDAPCLPFPLRVFAISTRGALKEQMLRTANFMHKTERITSCLIFALTCSMENSGLFLCPEISLILENGDEVRLVEDRLGPLIPPLLFFIDFSIADDGVNVQLDVIIRGHPGSGVPSPNEKTLPMKTLRTCLQDYVAFNSHLDKSYISMGYSNLASHLEDAFVYLQNLVISEEQRKPAKKGIREDKRLTRESFGNGIVVFEGEDVQSGLESLDLSAVHPQLRRCISDKAGKHPLLDKGVANSKFDWYHVLYEDKAKVEKSGFELMKGFTGEFWLSKPPVDKKYVHFHCSSTLAQALTMCIGFRFSCPPHYLLLMEQPDGHRQLRLTHIPTNAFIMGVEIDPRSTALVRMFVENRNTILDDMPIVEISECGTDDTIIHQEVYDSFDRLTYRVTLLKDGIQQTAALEVAVEQTEETDAYRSYHGNIDEPSSRFPTSKTAQCHNLSPINRIFIYTSVPHIVQEESAQQTELAAEEEVAAVMMTPAISEIAPEDFHSVCGGSVYGGQSDRQSDCCHSDCEADFSSQPLGQSPKNQMASEENAVSWRRPLIESVRIFRDVREPPFKCSNKCP